MNDYEVIHIQRNPSMFIIIKAEYVQPYMKCNKNYVETCHSIQDIKKNDIFCTLENGTYLKAISDPYINAGVVQIKCSIVEEKIYYGYH